jgi:hypothetical protein
MMLASLSSSQRLLVCVCFFVFVCVFQFMCAFSNACVRFLPDIRSLILLDHDLDAAPVVGLHHRDYLSINGIERETSEIERRRV